MNNINILNFKTLFLGFKKIQQYLRNKREFKDNKKIIINFFDLNVPCLQSTVKCQELREQYINDINNVQKHASCSSCSIVFIKNEYIKKLLDMQKMHLK